MKKILSGTVAAIALIAAATPAAAQTDTQHYAGLPLVGTLNNPGPVAEFLADLSVFGAQIGTRYRAQADAPGNTEAVTPTVDVVFSLSGTVQKDCSFYAGNDASARNISFGVIGVRTGNNENVNSAFEMVGDAEANIDTLTAGCNFNNEIVITKNNGTNGLVNSAAGGYDTTQFQANIPYRVTASWTGVAVGTVGAGTGKSLAVSEAQNNNLISQGAWRSRMDIDIVAPAVTNKGLVAGTYAGTTTLTLRAL